ncbi:MAG: glycosyltransferase family 39 protein [Flavobacteriales bacterium]|nr:glycosyltransferase family 39 protein [Flavobacteriales bacterium]
MNALNFLTTRDISVAKRRLWVFFGLWFVLSYLQGVFSGLNEDEPYYYMYSLYPAWGYFDHPPMVSVFIWIGTHLFGKLLGFRLISAVSSTLFLMAVWKIIENKDKWRYVNVFILLSMSIPMVSVYGFIIVPDAPLLFFVALFLLMYKRFLYSRSVSRALLLGVLAAAMMYSKYHGALVLVFVVLSNVSLLKNKYFYIAFATAVVLFIPHIFWQIENDFPSMKYHLVQRSAPEYDFAYTWEYPLNQLAVFGPFLLPMMIWAVIKSKVKTQVSNALKYIFWGFLLFFLIMTAKGHVEPHWTVVAIIPAMYFTFNFAVKSELWAKYFVFGSITTAVILIAARVLLLIPGLPTPYHNQYYWADSIHSTAGNAPVIFKDSYQKPSMYTFYTNEMSWSYNSLYSRSNQYDFFPIKDAIKGKEVLYLDGESTDVLIKNGDELIKGRWIDNFSVDSIAVKK